MNKKRDRLEVMHDIMRTIQVNRNECRPTKILYKSNLSHQMMNQYMDFMMSKGFVLVNEDENQKTFSLTDKGFEYLEKYKAIQEFVVNFDL